MKTAVSVPDEIFSRADRLAKRLRLTRSELYRRALSEYLARHSADAVTEALDRVCGEVAGDADPFVSQAARRVLAHSEW
jgi:predicted transcriptional regulator